MVRRCTRVPRCDAKRFSVFFHVNGKAKERRNRTESRYLVSSLDYASVPQRPLHFSIFHSSSSDRERSSMSKTATRGSLTLSLKLRPFARTSHQERFRSGSKRTIGGVAASRLRQTPAKELARMARRVTALERAPFHFRPSVVFSIERPSNISLLSRDRTSRTLRLIVNTVNAP